MAHFYGKLKGNRGEATRLGTKLSGIIAIAASWSGAVRTTLHQCDGIDMALVELIPWHGEGISKRLYLGPVAGPDTDEVKT